MGTATHTPGPWFVSAKDRHDQPTVQASNSRLVAVCAHECVDEAGAEANARLIAAAPDMLEALRPLARAADEFQWVLDKKLDPNGVFVWATSTNIESAEAPCISVADAFRARAAIAKATGAA